MRPVDCHYFILSGDLEQLIAMLAEFHFPNLLCLLFSDTRKVTSTGAIMGVTKS